MMLFRKKKFLRKPSANGHNIVGQQLLKLLNVTCCLPLHTLLHVVGVVAQSLKLVKLLSQQPNICFVPCLPEAQRKNVGSVCTALPTLLGPRTLISRGLRPGSKVCSEHMNDGSIFRQETQNKMKFFPKTNLEVFLRLNV